MTETNKIKCIVIDDEEAAIDVLQHFISRIPYLSYAGGYTSPLLGLQALHEENAELVFVDIHMPDISGIDLVKNIKNGCRIIFTTAYSEYALDGYDLNVTDYLLKPVAFPRFVTAVEKVKNIAPAIPAQKEDKEDFILVKGELKGKFFKISLHEISYIEGMKNYAAIVCTDKKIVSLLNLKDLEEKLSPDKFIRVHKSFIVSLKSISRIEGNKIILKQHPDANIVIGETYRHSFFEKMKNNMIG